MSTRTCRMIWLMCLVLFLMCVAMRWKRKDAPFPSQMVKLNSRWAVTNNGGDSDDEGQYNNGRRRIEEQREYSDKIYSRDNSFTLRRTCKSSPSRVHQIEKEQKGGAERFFRIFEPESSFNKSSSQPSLQNLKAFCAPYEYVRINQCKGGCHMCTWKPELDHISKKLHRGETWEQHILAEISRRLYGVGPGIIIDCGCNMGLYSLVAASMGHVVFSFDILLDHILMTSRALSMNAWEENAVVFYNGLSDEIGNKTINRIDTNNRGNTVLNRKRQEVHLSEAVSLITLDSLIPFVQNNYPSHSVHVLKADIEGYEPKMFNGAWSFILKFRPKLITFEVLGEFMKEHPSCDWIATIQNLMVIGYQLYSFEKKQTITLREWKMENLGDFSARVMEPGGADFIAVLE